MPEAREKSARLLRIENGQSREKRGVNLMTPRRVAFGFQAVLHRSPVNRQPVLAPPWCGEARFESADDRQTLGTGVKQVAHAGTQRDVAVEVAIEGIGILQVG